MQYTKAIYVGDATLVGVLARVLETFANTTNTKSELSVLAVSARANTANIGSIGSISARAFKCRDNFTHDPPRARTHDPPRSCGAEALLHAVQRVVHLWCIMQEAITRHGRVKRPLGPHAIQPTNTDRRGHCLIHRLGPIHGSQEDGVPSTDGAQGDVAPKSTVPKAMVSAQGDGAHPSRCRPMWHRRYGARADRAGARADDAQKPESMVPKPTSLESIETLMR